MVNEFLDYCVERSNEPRWYKLNLYYENGNTKSYAMHISNEMIINKGHIVSISGNGCSNESFQEANIKLYPFRSFDKGNENETLNYLEKKVCNK